MTDAHGAAHGPNHAVDYLSFLRGFAAALDHDATELAAEPAAYAEGVAAAAQPVAYPQRYRDLSVRSTAADHGSFRGTLWP